MYRKLSADEAGRRLLQDWEACGEPTVVVKAKDADEM